MKTTQIEVKTFYSVLFTVDEIRDLLEEYKESDLYPSLDEFMHGRDLTVYIDSKDLINDLLNPFFAQTTAHTELCKYIANTLDLGQMYFYGFIDRKSKTMTFTTYKYGDLMNI